MTSGPERDFVGYGRNPPDPKWPGGSRLALNIILNYEEGAEYSILDGDPHSESMLSEVAAQPYPGERNLNVESSYEYGSRAGVWRILRIFAERQVPLTIYGVGSALERNPAVAEETARMGCDYVGHGWRWIDYRNMPEAEEREHIKLCVESIERLTDKRPLGWFTGRPSLNTRRLVVEEGGFLYDCDAINDDLPYWVAVGGKQHLVICHTFDSNDGRYTRGAGIRHRRRLVHLHAGCFRLALSRRRACTEAPDGGDALPHDRTARPHQRPHPLPRSCGDARGRLAVPPGRDCAPLA